MVENIIQMFKEDNIIGIKIFLRRYGIYLPQSIPLAYVVEEKREFMHVHIYPQGFPIKILVTIDKEKKEVNADWVELERE